MEENTSLIEALIEKTVEYGKSSYDLAKLKILDKISELVSTVIQQVVVFIILLSFFLFLSLGIAFWLGQILGEIYFGFFVVAVFYGISAILTYSFLRKWIKRLVGNAFIKQVLK